MDLLAISKLKDDDNDGGGSYMAEHGNWPIFSTEFGTMVYILADFGRQEYCRTQKFCIFKNEIRQSYNPTDTDIA